MDITTNKMDITTNKISFEQHYENFNLHVLCVPLMLAVRFRLPTSYPLGVRPFPGPCVNAGCFVYRTVFFLLLCIIRVRS